MTTRGQELGLEQLREVERTADGTFELLDVRPPPAAGGLLRAEVSVSTSAFTRVPEGLPLRARERFLIFIPADFPFTVPIVRAPHRRFAGFAHVQWGRHLCLYVSPATEWDPSDGMYGFVSRLDLWLRTGALNELDPAGAPLHPPVVYVGSDLPLFIPKADTPRVVDAPWLGLAALRVVSGRRTDVVGWLDMFDTEAPSTVAAAILLPGSLPWEFPERARDVLDALEENGVERRLLRLVLALAALRGRRGDPLDVIVGAKMRGTRGSADLRQHLTVWRVSVEMADALRDSLPEQADTEQIKAIRERIGQLVATWIEGVKVAWCPVREDRPEIVTLRDDDAPMSCFRGKSVAVWGCGALGGAIAEALARAGVAKLLLRDKSTVAPGLLVRQPYDDSDVGEIKVVALKRRLCLIRPEDLEVDANNGDILADPLGSDDWTDGAELVFDTSASEAVLEKLEWRRRLQPNRRAAVVSMAVGHRAEIGLVVVADQGHSGGPADVIRRTKIAVCNRPDLRAFADEFWPTTDRGEVFQPEPGCSESTFIGSWADICTLAGSMLNLAAQDIEDQSANTATAHIVPQPRFRRSVSSPLEASFSWSPDLVFEDPHAGYSIRVAPGAWRDMRGWVETSRRRVGDGYETGGVLFGERDDASGVMWVSEVVGPPSDSESAPELFVCGIRGLATINEEKVARTRGSVGFVGMWHTHPVSAPLPSATDFEGVRRIVKEGRTPRLLMLIIGGTSGDEPWQVGSYVFTRADFSELRSGRLIRQCEVRQVDSLMPEGGVGIALSGGGTRAIAFHLGCLRALHDRGLLDRIDVISGVSGGAVIAGMFAYSAGSFAEFEESVSQLLRKGLSGRIIRQATVSRTGVRSLLTVAVSGSAAVAASCVRLVVALLSRLARRPAGHAAWSENIQPPLRRWSSRTHALERVLRDQLFGPTRMADPRRNNVNVVINACELRTGTAFRFGSRESGNWRLHRVKGNDVDVARAVAASAAYPAAFPAIDQEMTFVRPDGSEVLNRVLLTDGGVYENLGVAPLEPGRSSRYGYNTYNPDFIISCDAGPGQFGASSVPYHWPSRMVRAFNTVFRKAHDAVLSRLHAAVPAGQLRGFVLAYLGQQDGALPGPPDDLVTRERVVYYPTDFSPMSEEAIDCISKRGEQLTRLLVTRYCSEL